MPVGIRNTFKEADCRAFGTGDPSHTGNDTVTLKTHRVGTDVSTVRLSVQYLQTTADKSDLSLRGLTI